LAFVWLGLFFLHFCFSFSTPSTRFFDFFFFSFFSNFFYIFFQFILLSLLLITLLFPSSSTYQVPLNGAHLRVVGFYLGGCCCRRLFLGGKRKPDYMLACVARPGMRRNTRSISGASASFPQTLSVPVRAALPFVAKQISEEIACRLMMRSCREGFLGRCLLLMDVFRPRFACGLPGRPST
jgi:hypothetical protein